MAKVECNEAECRQSVESFFHRESEGTPAGGEIGDDLLSEHDDERLGPGAGCAA